MNKKLLLCMTAASVLAVGIGFVFFGRKPVTEPTANKASPGQSTRAPTTTQFGVKETIPLAEKHVVSKAPLSNDPRTLFLDEAGNRAARFAAISQMARAGNADAKYFQVQMAMDCEVATRANSDPSILSNAKPQSRAQIARALQLLATGCEALLKTADYAEFKAGGEVARDTYESDVITRMKESFASSGAGELRNEMFAALGSRPDETTAATIIDTYAGMGLLDSLTGDKNNASSLPARREQLMYALNLLTCDYGRDCGPNSAVVASYCISLGACDAGADLQQLYSSRLLSGLDFQNVMDLRDHLRSLQKH